jgi:hypothetical protein
MCGFVIAVDGHSKLAGFAARAMFMLLQQSMCMQGKHCLREPCSLLSAAEQHSTIWVKAVRIVVCVDLHVRFTTSSRGLQACLVAAKLGHM